jgi:cytochrome c oxidase assembly protein subunit 11
VEKSPIPIVIKSAVVVAVMFSIVFVVMVPLYNVLCDALGLNGKTDGTAYVAEKIEVDTSRSIDVQFIARNNEGMVWAFRPNEFKVSVHPGELRGTSFFAQNPAAEKMVAQAVPSIVPAEAADYFHKTECFCFSQQTLKAGEAVDMPLRFVIDQSLPEEIETITLSYTLFDVTHGFSAQNNKVAKNL